MKKIVLWACLLGTISCQKVEQPTPVSPVVVTTPTCQIQTETGVNNAYKLEYVYDADKYITAMNVSVKDNTTNQLKNVANITYFYQNGLLSKVVDGAVEEILSYNANGALNKLVVTKTDETAYLNYTLNFETDINKRVTKLTDSKGVQTVISRDAQGNITQTLTTDANGKEVYKIVLSDYDNKKSLADSYKGWATSVLGYYADYIKFPLFTVGAGGNAKKRVEYKDGKPLQETTYTYTYSADGYPLTEQSLTKFSDGSGISTYSRTFTYTACK